jgi:uncharacterized metal-binding protein YceD (DUF177 family)
MNDLDVLLRIPWARIPFGGQLVEVDLDGALAAKLLAAVCTGIDGDVSVRGQVTPSGRRSFVVDGVIAAPIQFQCVRCLESGAMRLEGSFTHTFRPKEKAPQGEGGEGQWEGVSDLSGDYLDLEPLILEEFALLLPLHPSCEDAIGGRTCGFKEPEHEDFEKPVVDPRWAVLGSVKLEDDP